MIFNKCTVLSHLAFFQLLDNSNIFDSHFEGFLTSQSSGCILLDSAISLNVMRTLFLNISTTSPFNGTPYSGAAIHSSIATVNLDLISTCFIDCRCNHGYSFGCFGTGHVSFNFSTRCSSLTYGKKYPSFIYNYNTIASSDVNTSNSLDGSIMLYSKTCTFKYYLVSNSYAGDWAASCHYFIDVSSAKADFLTFVNGTASGIFSSPGGIEIGSIHAGTSCGLGSGVTKISCLYYTTSFDINRVSLEIEIKLQVENLLDEFKIQEVKCDLFLQYDEMITNTGCLKMKLFISLLIGSFFF